jgi:YD repeat-containing protein
MKTILLFIFGVFVFTNSQAQISYSSAQQSATYQDNWQYYFNIYHSYYRGVSKLAIYSDKNTEKDLKSKVKLLYHFKKGIKKEQAYSKSTYAYTDGLLTSYKYFKKDKLKNQFSLEYNEDGYFTRYYTGSVNSPRYDEHLVFNDSNLVVLYSRYNKKRKLKRKKIIEYDDNQNMVRKDIYDGKHLDPKYSWQYKYDEKGNTVQTEYYKKGILKTKWVYTCDDEGTKVDNKKVSVSTSCSLVEHNNDGSYVKIYRYTNSKGKIRKNRWTYSKDSVLTMSERFNNKGVITSKYTYEYDKEGNRNVYTYYKKGGEKVKHQTKYKYNGDKKITEMAVYNGKGNLRSKKQYKYDADGNTIAYTNINSKGEISWKYEYTYDKNGGLISELTYKKDKPFAQYNIEFKH